MRRRTATVLTVAALTVPTSLPAAAVAAEPDQRGTRSEGRAVGYRGYRIVVPAHWRVVDLTARPHACLRLDRPAVYLGHAADQRSCPASLVGGAPVLHVEPLDARSAALFADAAPEATVRVRPGSARPADRLPAVGGPVSLAVRPAGVVVSATYAGTAARVVRRVLAGARVGRSAHPSTHSLNRKAPARSGVVAPGSYRGKGFDACTAASQAAMDTWRTRSPYRAVNIYFGGISRGCAQPNLTRTWVGKQATRGWHLIPTYVGRQAPCSRYPHRISANPDTARAQGRAEAADAVARARGLGLGRGSVLYSDMEGYDSGNDTCRRAVLSYLSAWTNRLHTDGFRSGVYSSISSGIRDLARVYRSPAYSRPDHIWLAWWNGVANTDGGSYLDDSLWSRNQRIHQYAGNVTEAWGGVRINIDRNFLDVGAQAGGNDDPPKGCPTTVSFAGYPDLSPGAEGPKVRAAQCQLARRGFDPGPANGVYGAATRSAVAAFKASRRLPADGILGEHAWTALLSGGPTPLLSRGDSGRPVRRLQRALTAALGTTVAVTGEFDRRTARAVRGYQDTRGLAVDAVVGPRTWGALQAGR